MLKADLHIHSCYSMDSLTTPEEIVNTCLQKGINCVAITDHGTIAGALKLREIAPFTVIVGEEVLTPSGEIMGLFLTEEIPSGTSLKETLKRIKEQGGLVCLQHPFDSFRFSSAKNGMVEEALPYLDLVEVFNSRSLRKGNSRRAELFAQQHHLPAGAGSDAHTPYEIGRAYIEMPEFQGAQDFLKSLKQGKVFGQRTTPLIHIMTTLTRLKKLYFG